MIHMHNKMMHNMIKNNEVSNDVSNDPATWYRVILVLASLKKKSLLIRF